MKLHYGLDDLKDIDFMAFIPIILPFLAVGLLLVSIALIDLYRHRNTRENVLIWTFVILFVNTIGPILYLVIGRKDSDRS
ncbi:PLD nuclease N-terminal domain-containing protein [Peribacillus sp. NPDC097895]|uniref:PLD nuclease N-terminal domain-containing protein n=1 Tax=Peribacillus sp. NPDC097895 TaxID=3390619 RepID=UPI003D0424BE